MKKKAAFVIIPLILIVIVGIWFLKNGRNKENISSEIQTEARTDI